MIALAFFDSCVASELVVVTVALRATSNELLSKGRKLNVEQLVRICIRLEVRTAKASEFVQVASKFCMPDLQCNVAPELPKHANPYCYFDYHP